VSDHPIHQEFAQKFADAAASDQPAVIDVGRTVLCDVCSEDLTDDGLRGSVPGGNEIRITPGMPVRPS
jgi:hypothetical protein